MSSSHTHSDHTRTRWICGGKTSAFIRLMQSRGKKTHFLGFYDLLCGRNVKLWMWDISYLSDLEVGREYFSSSLHDLWLLQKCEIEYMSISILPYDNISNWRDLGVWEVGCCIHNRHPWKRRWQLIRLESLSKQRWHISKFGFCGQWLHIVWLLIYLMVDQGDMKCRSYEMSYYSL